MAGRSVGCLRKMSVKATYGRALWLSLREYAVWEPGRQVRIGDYGVVREHCFHHLGNIDQFNVQITPDRSPSQTAFLKVLSKNAMASRLGADALKELASLNLSFGGEGGACMYAGNSELTSVFATGGIGPQLKRQLAWKMHWKVVTGVRVAQQFSIVGTDEKNASVELAGDAALLDQFSAGTLTEGILKASGGLEVRGTSVTQFLGATGPISVELRQVKMIGDGLYGFQGDGRYIEPQYELTPVTDSPEAFNDAV